MVSGSTFLCNHSFSVQLETLDVFWGLLKGCLFVFSGLWIWFDWLDYNDFLYCTLDMDLESVKKMWLIHLYAYENKFNDPDHIKQIIFYCVDHIQIHTDTVVYNYILIHTHTDICIYIQIHMKTQIQTEIQIHAYIQIEIQLQRCIQIQTVSYKYRQLQIV